MVHSSIFPHFSKYGSEERAVWEEMTSSISATSSSFSGGETKMFLNQLRDTVTVTVCSGLAPKASFQLNISLASHPGDILLWTPNHLNWGVAQHKNY